MGTDDYWQKLVECGWITVIPENRQAELKRRLQEQAEEDPAVLFRALAVVSFDLDHPEAERIEEIEGNCTARIHALAAASDDWFKPADVRCEVDRADEDLEVIRVSFTHAGKRFRCSAEWEEGWFEEAVLDLVNEAMNGSGNDARFHLLPGTDTRAYLALAPDAVFARAVEMGLIPESEAEEG